jgi:hypothetical protein
MVRAKDGMSHIIQISGTPPFPVVAAETGGFLELAGMVGGDALLERMDTISPGIEAKRFLYDFGPL